jgi:hypothetical protein
MKVLPLEAMTGFWRVGSKAATGLFQNGRNFSLGGKAAVPLSGLRRGLDFDGLWVGSCLTAFG